MSRVAEMMYDDRYIDNSRTYVQPKISEEDRRYSELVVLHARMWAEPSIAELNTMATDWVSERTRGGVAGYAKHQNKSNVFMARKTLCQAVNGGGTPQQIDDAYNGLSRARNEAYGV